MTDILAIFNRCHECEVSYGRYKWKNPENDAIVLKYLASRLIRQVQAMNSALEKPEDICPCCADHRWNRPNHLAPLPRSSTDATEPIWQMDYTRRQCRDCMTIRPEPPSAEGNE